MPTTEIQAGTARINGIQNSGSDITCTVVSQALAAFNASSVGFTDEFDGQQIGSMNGAVVETLIGARRFRTLQIELIPSGTTRALAQANLDNILDNLTPYCVFTLANFFDARFNGTFNYMGGGEVTLKRDTFVIANVRISQFETAATANTFAALAIAT